MYAFLFVMLSLANKLQIKHHLLVVSKSFLSKIEPKLDFENFKHSLTVTLLSFDSLLSQPQM